METVDELIEALREGKKRGDWRGDSKIVVVDASTSYYHDLHGPRKHEPDVEEGKPGDCVLWIGS